LGQGVGEKFKQSVVVADRIEQLDQVERCGGYRSGVQAVGQATLFQVLAVYRLYQLRSPPGLRCHESPIPGRSPARGPGGGATFRFTTLFVPARMEVPPELIPSSMICTLIRTPVLYLLAAVAWLPLAPVSATDRNPSAVGKAIYADACASCHGDQGQGNADYYDDSLAGDLSVRELADIIAETMPENDPESCVGDHAEAVAAFVHQAFYSPAAQARLNPPQRQLARLTAEQLRQSLAGLYGHFYAAPWTTTERGIEGNYFTGQGWGDERLRIQRTDGGIDFDFGIYGPGDGVDPQQYYIHWDGSLLVPTSGSYEIVVRSSCSFKMQFGRLGPLFINNHVQSAGKEEFRRTVHLTGGRAYPIKIDLQQRKRKTEQPPVYISLAWVPPGGVEQIIPTRYLLPDPFPPSFALQAKLPPDDRSYGYQRGISIDRSWDESTTNAALEFAEIAIEDLFPRHLKQHGQENRREKLKEFLSELVETALRRPFDDPLRATYIDQPLAASGEDEAEAIRRAVLMVLKSPRFLYPTLDTDRNRSRRVANRLALVMYDSLPSDRWLMEMVEKNRLQSRGRFEQAAWRMVDDYRARTKIRSFLHHWLDLERPGELIKDEELYPEFDAALVTDLRQSLDAFLDEIVASEASDFRLLLQADWAMTNERLAEFYGKAWERSYAHQSVDKRMEAVTFHPPPGDGSYATFTRSVSDPEKHVGVLTHPLLMSHLAHIKATSPIHRGVFLSRYVLGRIIRPPQEAFQPFDAQLHPDLTTRQRVALQTSSVNCQVCHRKINSLGFALEHFDAVGRYRQRDNDRPVDASGFYQPRQGEPVEFAGARQLGDYLATSEDCQRSFVEAAFEHFVKQPVAAYGTNVANQLLKRFRRSGYHIRGLIVEIARIAAFEPTRKSAT